MLKNSVFLTIIISLLSISFCSNTLANTKETNVVVKVKEGNLTLNQLFEACKTIAKSKPSRAIDKSLLGKIITINGKNYEIRLFSFEDTTGTLDKNLTFKRYAEQNKIANMKSTSMNPFQNIHFESFEYRKAGLNDGVYFMANLRLM